MRYYDLDKEVTFKYDASSHGLGAALLQNGQPVAYASRSLTNCETRFAQIEKECLAILFACERFDLYLYGREKITVETDHQPLVSIFKKSLEAAPLRLQTMRMRLHWYSIEVVYKKSRYSVVPCRHFKPSGGTSELCSPRSADTTKSIESVVTLIREDNIQKIQRATANDQSLSKLSAVIKSGWPHLKSQIDDTTRPYFSFRDELTVHDGLIFD